MMIPDQTTACEEKDRKRSRQITQQHRQRQTHEKKRDEVEGMRPVVRAFEIFVDGHDDEFLLRYAPSEPVPFISNTDHQRVSNLSRMA